MDKAVMSVRMKKWARILQEAATSGLTKTEFCAQNGIDRRQFFHWQKKIREYVLQQNTELGVPPSHGQMQQIRAVNSQIIPSLPVFVELKPKEEPSSDKPFNIGTDSICFTVSSESADPHVHLLLHL